MCPKSLASEIRYFIQHKSNLCTCEYIKHGQARESRGKQVGIRRRNQRVERLAVHTLVALEYRVPLLFSISPSAKVSVCFRPHTTLQGCQLCHADVRASPPFPPPKEVPSQLSVLERGEAVRQDHQRPCHPPSPQYMCPSLNMPASASKECAK